MAKLSKRFDEALAYASDLHRDQRRKGTEIPYLSHLLGVAAIVLECGGSEDEAIAGLLHDSLEDQSERTSLHAIASKFGDEVAATVLACSDSTVTPKPPWRKRKEEYLKHLALGAESSLLVSAADKLHNVRSIIGDYRVLGEKLWKRFKGGRDGTLWYYQAVLGALKKRRVQRLSPIVEELARNVAELRRLAANSES